MSRHRRGLRVPLLLLLGLHLASLVDGFLAPHSAFEQHRELPWAPPTPVHFVDADGRFHLRPFVYPLVNTAPEPDVYTADRSRPVPLRFFVRGEGYKLFGLFDTDLHLVGVDAPASLMFFGTDGLGRDVFARFLLGARISLFAGLLAAGLALAAGFLLGASAGFYGGRLDSLLMRLVELFLALPWLYLLFGVRALLPLDFEPAGAFLLFVTLIAGIGWAAPARIFRGQARGLRGRDFVLAARGIGASHREIVWRHVLPHTLALAWTQFALLVPRYILAEASLSFLGLGIGDAVPSWGNMLSSLERYHVLVSYGWMFSPAVALLVVVLCYQRVAGRLAERGPAGAP